MSKRKDPEVKWLETGTFLVVVIEGIRPINIEVGSEKYKKTINFIKKGDTRSLIQYLSKKDNIQKYVKDSISIDREGKATIKGKIVSNEILKLIDNFREEKLPYAPLEKFMANLDKNPNNDSKKNLFIFLQHNQVTLTEDGCFLGYKKVNKKYGGSLVDRHTGRFNNNVGQIVSMPREKVNPNRNESCSTGLHIAADEYARDFLGDTLITVKVNPRDVCAVPSDYNNQKMRVCQYEVLAVGIPSYPGSYFPWDKSKLVTKKKDVNASLPEEVTSMEIDFDKLSGRQIIDAIYRVTKIKIEVSPKSKKSVIKHAKRIIKENENKFIVLSKMSGREIIKYIKSGYKEDITCSHKSKKSVIKYAKEILNKKGIPYLV